MAKLGLPEETKKVVEGAGTADLLIAMVAPVNVEHLRAAASETLLRMLEMNSKISDPSSDPSPAGLRAAIAFPGTGGAAERSPDSSVHLDPGGSGTELLFFPLNISAGNSAIPWLGQLGAYQVLFAMARELGVRACAVIAPDLLALKADRLMPLLTAVLDKRCDLAMPIYPTGKFEGLLNSGILAPLTRSLFGKRIRFPLAQDFAVSGRLLPDLEQTMQRGASQGKTLFWPSTEVALRDGAICQIYEDLRHSALLEGIEVSTLLAQTVGPLFAEMEVNAAAWQRVRGSQPVEVLGNPHPPQSDEAPVDIRPMLETFVLGSRSLQEMWSLILPPITLLELRKLARLSPEQFRMPDELWVRIIYDFALAYRLRTLSRIHLLGALTPLYLGWVASHVLEISRMRPHEVEQRLEKLARAYEDGKPYLLSRWRWPDRFNP